MLKKINLLLLIVSITVVNSYAKNISITKTAVAPTIDGIGNESLWANLKVNYVDQVRNNTTGISGQFKICYDDKYIYVLVTVDDNTPNQVQNNQTYAGDNVELYFAMDTNNANSYRPGDWEIRKLNSKTQANGGVDGSANVANVLLKDANFKVMQVNGNNSLVQEWQIPINTLKQTAKFDAKNFRFEVQICNNNGTGRIGQLYWNSNADDQWNKIKNQGYAQFDIVSAINDLYTKEAEINIYPNPFIQYLNISNTDFSTKDYIKILNLEGKIVREIILTNSQNNLNLSDLKTGTYFIYYLNKNSEILQSSKIIKE